MPASPRNELARILAEIKAKFREAESLTVAKGDDETLQRASKVLADFTAQRQDVEAKLKGDNGRRIKKNAPRIARASKGANKVASNVAAAAIQVSV